MSFLFLFIDFSAAYGSSFFVSLCASFKLDIRHFKFYIVGCCIFDIPLNTICLFER